MHRTNIGHKIEIKYNQGRTNIGHVTHSKKKYTKIGLKTKATSSKQQLKTAFTSSLLRNNHLTSSIKKTVKLFIKIVDFQNISKPFERRRCKMLSFIFNNEHTS